MGLSQRTSLGSRAAREFGREVATARQAREAPMNETDMQCDIAFDLTVGWPK